VPSAERKTPDQDSLARGTEELAVETAATALRDVQDAFAAARPPVDLLGDVTWQLRAITRQLRAHRAPEPDRIVGRLPTPGRGQTMSPELVIDHDSGDDMRGRVRFSAYYHGRNGAVHGGALALLFDEALGRLANGGRRPPSRTAYLRTDFRSIARIETDLLVHAWVERHEGRKIVLRATLLDGETIVAEGEALFVTLRPDQP
jgi:acyl-coenzyme A thioesterase PaaI-like protein